jgi:hypothetical protein
MDPTAIAQGTTIGRNYAYYIVAGTRIPHPWHYPNLVALVGVELPRTFAAAVSWPIFAIRRRPVRLRAEPQSDVGGLQL